LGTRKAAPGMIQTIGAGCERAPKLELGNQKSGD